MPAVSRDRLLARQQVAPFRFIENSLTVTIFEIPEKKLTVPLLGYGEMSRRNFRFAFERIRILSAGFIARLAR